MRSTEINHKSLLLLSLFSLGMLESAVCRISLAAEGDPSIAAAPILVGETDKNVRISPGDVVAIQVYPAEEYSREVTVQPDGKIELPLIGSLLVKGLTSRELQDLLRERYSRFVANPQITVSIRRFAGRRVAILGEVKSPGYYEYRDGMKLLDLVSQAGGFSDDARLGKVRILRPGLGEGYIQVNFREIMAGRFDLDPQMAPGDTVYIPKWHFTIGAEWATKNILPWLSVMTLISSIILLVHTQTGASSGTPGR